MSTSLLLLLTLLAAAPPTSCAEPPTGQVVHGTVVDAAGQPVSGAIVACDYLFVRSKGDGSFALDLGEPAASGERSTLRTLIAAAPGKLPGRLETDIAAAEAGDAARELRLGGDCSRLAGTVVDAAGRPIEEAWVWIADPTVLADDPDGGLIYVENACAGEWKTGWLRVETDRDGRFELEGLGPRDYVVAVMDPITMERAVSESRPAGSNDVRVVLGGGVNATVAGRVVDSRGEPVAGARVVPRCDAFVARIDGWVSVSHHGLEGTTTGKDGRFALSRIATDGYLEVSHEEADKLEYGRYLDGDERFVGTTPRGLPADIAADLEIVLPMTCYVRVEQAGAADSAALLDAGGTALPLAIVGFGQTEGIGHRVELDGGRSPVLEVTDAARTLVLYAGDAEVGRTAVRLVRGEVEVVRPAQAPAATEPAASEPVPGAPAPRRSTAAGDPQSERWLQAMDVVGAPGLAVAVVRKGEEPVFTCLGSRDLAGREPVTPDTVFYIASCTKVFVATAVAILAQEGTLALEAPVERHLPGVPLDAAGEPPVTVRELLAHARGLRCWPIQFTEAYTGEITDERYVRWMGAAEAAGTARYSNLHYSLVGRVIARAAGRPWQTVVEERVLAPAGLTSTSCRVSTVRGPDVAVPAVRDPDGSFAAAPVRKTDRTMHAAGGMVSSARDLARFLLIQLGPGADGKPALPAEAVAATQVLQAAVEGEEENLAGFQQEGFGLGWQIGRYDGRRVLRHGGGFAGSASLMTVLPEDGIGVVVLTNAGDAAGGLCELVTMDVLDRHLGVEADKDLLSVLSELGGRVRKNAREQAALESGGRVTGASLPGGLAAYTGRYASDEWGAVTVSSEHDALALAWGDLALELYAIDGERFAATAGPNVRFNGHFTSGPDGATALVLETDDLGAVVFRRV